MKLARRSLISTVALSLTFAGVSQGLGASSSATATNGNSPGQFGGYVVPTGATMPTGTIAGVVGIGGGPTRRAGGKRSRPSGVTVTATRGRLVVKTRTNGKGAFTLHIRPGTYRLSASAPGCLATSVRVSTRHVTYVHLICSIR